MAKCECSDPGCPIHKNKSKCDNNARYCMMHVDMDDETGTLMCMSCGEDASDCGLFRHSIKGWIAATKKGGSYNEKAK